MGKIYMIGAQKGGVAKTVTVFNLAYCLAKLGKKVLAVDLDSQANLSTCYGVDKNEKTNDTIGHLMMSVIENERLPKKERYIKHKEGVDFIAASLYLSVVDAKLKLEVGAEQILSEVLEPLRNEYDYILIDTCPSLGTLTINALAVADEVIIPVNPQLLAMMGLQDFLSTYAKIKRRINPSLKIAGILLTMCESRTTLCKVLTEEVKETFYEKIKVFESQIPNTIKVGESVYYGKTIVEYSPKSSASIAYKKFAKELIANEE